MIPFSFPRARRAVSALFLCGAAAVLAQAPVPAPLTLAPNDPAERLSGYLRTLAGDPSDVVALNGAGRAALEIGDVNGALGFYGRASQAAPQNGDAKAGLAAALVQLEQPRRALPLFAQAVQLGVPTATIAADRGLAYDLIGDGASAQRDYASALAARDSDETRRRYALSLGIAGQRDKALDLLDPLVRRRDPAGWRARAFVMALTGDTAGASSIVQVMMPSQSAAMAPFLGELARLNPAQKAAAVNFGDMPAAGAPGGAGTQLAARDATPMPNPRPAPVPAAVYLPAAPPAPAPARPVIRAVEASPPPQRAVPIFVAPAPAPAPVAAARVYATAPQRAPAVPLRAAPTTVAVTQPQPQPVAPAPLPAVTPTPLPPPGPERTAAIVPSSALPAEVRPGVAGVPTVTSAATFAGPPAPVPTPVPQPVPSPAIATVALPPAHIAPSPPERIALAEMPHGERAAPAGAVEQSDRIGPFRTVAKSEIDRQRTQLADVPAPAAKTRKPDDTGGSRDEGSPGKSADARARAGRHDDAASPSAHERSNPKDAELDDSTSARRASRGAKTAADEKSTRSAKAKPDRSDDADAAPAKSGRSKSGKPADEDDTASSKSSVKAKHAKAADDDDAKPAAKRARRGDSDEDDASTRGGRVYVQVAGGANKDDLPKAWAQVKGKAPALLKGKTPSTTPLRFTNRLLVGPFKDADEAQGFVNKLAGKGLSGSVFKSDKGQKIEKVPAAK